MSISVIAVAACLIRSLAQLRSFLMGPVVPGAALKIVELNLLRI